jgi:hypothetical protein
MHAISHSICTVYWQLHATLQQIDLRDRHAADNAALLVVDENDRQHNGCYD